MRGNFAASEGATQLSRLYQTGGLRLYARHAAGCEAALLNTAGGMAGGDCAVLRFEAETSAQVVLTTQAPEKIYRSHCGPAFVKMRLEIGPDARLEWLPQETILFDQAWLERDLQVDMAETASLLLAETQVFGRLAKGESKMTGALHESWRIRRGAKLVFAEELRIEGEIWQKLDRKALGHGARAIGVLLFIAPGAENRLEDFRARMAALESGGVGFAASAWNGMLSARFASASPEFLRGAMVMALCALRGRAAPRVWQV